MSRRLRDPRESPTSLSKASVAHPSKDFAFSAPRRPRRPAPPLRCKSRRLWPAPAGDPPRGLRRSAKLRQRKPPEIHRTRQAHKSRPSPRRSCLVRHAAPPVACSAARPPRRRGEAVSPPHGWLSGAHCRAGARESERGLPATRSAKKNDAPAVLVRSYIRDLWKHLHEPRALNSGK